MASPRLADRQTDRQSHSGPCPYSFRPYVSGRGHAAGGGHSDPTGGWEQEAARASICYRGTQWFISRAREGARDSRNAAHNVDRRSVLSLPSLIIRKEALTSEHVLRRRHMCSRYMPAPLPVAHAPTRARALFVAPISQVHNQSVSLSKSICIKLRRGKTTSTICNSVRQNFGFRG